MKRVIGAVVFLMIMSSGSAAGEALHEAVAAKDLNKTKILLSGHPGLVDSRNERGQTAFHITALAGDTAMAALLLSFGANPNLADWDWRTALHLSAMKGHDYYIEWLLNFKVNKELQTYTGLTPLHEAVKAGQLKSVMMLYALGADLGTRTFCGETVLHTASAGGDTAMTCWLFSRGADVNGTNRFGQTPLHYAAFTGLKDVAMLLIRLGARVNERSMDGRTPYNWAVEKGFSDVASCLSDAGAHTGSRQTARLKGPFLGLRPPGREPEIFAPGVVSTTGFEFALTFSPDGKEIYFTRRDGEDKLPKNTIMVMHETLNGWSWPEIASFSGQWFDFEPHVSPDGRYLIFGSQRPLPGDTISTGMHQWILEKSNDSWSEPNPMPEPFISRFVMYVTTTFQGSVYFTGMVPGQWGGIYVSSYENGQYASPRRLPETVNRYPNSAHPLIAPDESFLIYDAQPRAPDNFGSEFFICLREDNHWTRAISMGEAMNASPHIMCASLSPDGKYLFFAREGDIYWVDAAVIADLKEKVLTDREEQ